MAEQTTTRKAFAISLIIILLVLAFFLIKPYISAIIFAIVFAYIFNPFFNLLDDKTKHKHKNGISLAICLIIIIVILAISFFLAPIIVKESFSFYQNTQKIDLGEPVRQFVLTTFKQDIGRDLSMSLNQIVTRATLFLMNSVSKFIEDAPTMLLQIFVMFFVMFFFLRDGKEISSKLKDIMPFREEIRDKFFTRFKEIVKGVVWGYIILGLIQGISMAIGFYAFGAPQPLLLSVVSTLLAILPILGSGLVWVPAGIIMLISGNVAGGLGLLIYCALVSAVIIYTLTPLILSKQTKLSPLTILLGMLGGLSVFGAIGIILGPIILDYLLLFIDYYRTGRLAEIT